MISRSQCNRTENGKLLCCQHIRQWTKTKQQFSPGRKMHDENMSQCNEAKEKLSFARVKFTANNRAVLLETTSSTMENCMAYMSQTGKIITPPFYKHNTFKIFHLAFSTVVGADSCAQQQRWLQSESAWRTQMNDESFASQSSFHRNRTSVCSVDTCYLSCAHSC